MDILLLAITVISLVVAFIMSAAAWRLSREERARSAARIAALASAARESDVVAESREHVRQESEHRPSALETEPLVDWEPVAVNDSRPLAPWAPARVSAFPSEAQDRRSTEPDDRHAEWRGSKPTAPAFSAVVATSGGGRQRSLAIAACVLFVALVAGGYWTIYGDAPGGVAAADRSSAAAPLELVSMRHERRGAKLSITGLVRNPSGGAAVERLAAVVFLFDQQSAFVASARADVDFTRLGPGDESPFVVAVDAPPNVARYRVSFRNEAGVVSHVDRRGQEPIARDLP
jgi:hypothetical protein